MSEKIVQLNEDVIKGKSRNWYAAVWSKPLTNCWRPRLKDLPKLAGMSATNSARGTAVATIAEI